jgi:Rrf2 family transcriptional regulator, cysteine metabolism repressor
MKISTKGRYGLRVMVELADHYGKGPLPVETISKNQEISGKYIHVLVASLRMAGLIRTARGPNGGHELARRPSAITAFDIVSALEGKSSPVECVNNASLCHRSGHCATRELWCDVASAIDGVLSDLTLEQLATRQRVKKNEPVSYEI